MRASVGRLFDEQPDAADRTGDEQTEPTKASGADFIDSRCAALAYRRGRHPVVYGPPEMGGEVDRSGHATKTRYYPLNSPGCSEKSQW